MSLRRALPKLVLALVISGAITLALLNRQALESANIDVWLDALGMWAPVAFLVLWVAWAVLFLPGAILGIAGGAFFGPVLGTLLTLTGATLGATVAFVVGRYLASDWVAQKAGLRLGHLLEGVKSEGWRFVAFTRLVPVFPFNLLNYVLGVTGIRLSTYVMTTFVCMAPGTLAYTYLGYAGREALTAGENLLQKGLIALGLLVTVAFLPRLVTIIRGAGRRWIEPSELASSNVDVVVVDVRSEAEFNGALGHIAGSWNIPLDELEARIDELLSLGERRIALICKTDIRSAKGAQLLRDRGLQNVSVVRGGIERWNASIASAAATGR
jgi:uncharacterized membrane protein YdjX (TVP38/TMEM64 family)/rhodanese-related sulfurtransferase